MAATAKNPALLSPRRDYIFILSHMRAHTSLASHVLGSHPEITGHSEMHQGYSTALDLLKLRAKVSIDNANTLRGRYVLDKLVNDYPLAQSIIAAPSTKVIFILRRPESTLKSIVSMGLKYGGVDWHRDPQQVLEYYARRLSQLEEIATTRAAADAPPAFFFESELLLDHTAQVLKDLSRWLGLATELSPRYEVFETTGQLGWGDPSGAIRSAQVVKSANRHEGIEIGADVLQAAMRPFERCRDTLLRVCESPSL